jgi:hypothetical protein
MHDPPAQWMTCRVSVEAAVSGLGNCCELAGGHLAAIGDAAITQQTQTAPPAIALSE